MSEMVEQDSVAMGNALWTSSVSGNDLVISGRMVMAALAFRDVDM